MKKKKIKRREEKEENNKKKISKSYTKKEKSKILGHMVAPVHFDPKILPKGSASDGCGRDKGPHISQLLWSRGKKKALNLGGPSSTDLSYF